MFYNENYLDQMLQPDVGLDYEKPATPHHSEPKLKDVCSFQQIHTYISHTARISLSDIGS